MTSLLTKASKTKVSNVSLSEFSIMMLKRASRVSCRNWNRCHTVIPEQCLAKHVQHYMTSFCSTMLLRCALFKKRLCNLEPFVPHYSSVLILNKYGLLNSTRVQNYCIFSKRYKGSVIYCNVVLISNQAENEDTQQNKIGKHVVIKT